MRPLAQVEEDEEALAQSLESLSDGERKSFYAQAERLYKDPDTYTTLCYLWVSGLHHFYLQRWKRGLMDIGFNLLALGLLIGGIAMQSWALALTAVAIWGTVSVLELRYLFQGQSVVRDYNLQKQRGILEKLRWQG